MAALAPRRFALQQAHTNIEGNTGEGIMEHGYDRYRTGCRCDVCKAANTRKVKEYRLRGPQSIDPAPVRDHVTLLRAAGMSQNTIAKKAGLSISTINRFVYPKYYGKRMLRHNAAKILAIKPGEDPQEIVSAIPTQRRIRALMWMGWDQDSITERSGISSSVLCAVSTGRRKHVRISTHNSMKRLYDEISMIHGPSERVAKWAEHRRWLPPLAWDDPDDLSERRIWGETVHWTVQKKKRRAR